MSRENYEQPYTCPQCGKVIKRKQARWTYDVCGIPFRLLCAECESEIEDFDGRDYRFDCCETIF